jgi:hypothetical protein
MFTLPLSLGLDAYLFELDLCSTLCASVSAARAYGPQADLAQGTEQHLCPFSPSSPAQPSFDSPQGNLVSHLAV